MVEKQRLLEEGKQRNIQILAIDLQRFQLKQKTSRISSHDVILS